METELLVGSSSGIRAPGMPRKPSSFSGGYGGGNCSIAIGVIPNLVSLTEDFLCVVAKACNQTKIINTLN